MKVKAVKIAAAPRAPKSHVFKFLLRFMFQASDRCGPMLVARPGRPGREIQIRWIR
jgi:hypothetical protein